MRRTNIGEIDDVGNDKINQETAKTYACNVKLKLLTKIMIKIVDEKK
jgi:hypothetical protein